MSAYRRLFAIAAAAVLAPAFAAEPKPDIENGKTTFTIMCGICHAASKEPGGPTQGPNLMGIVGRKAATVADFTMYSPSLKDSKITWSTKTLDEFLENPMIMVPQTTMPMLIPDKKTRADVIAYLATLKP